MKSQQPPAEKRLLLYSSPARLLLYTAVTAQFLAVVCVVAAAYILSDIVDRIFLKGQALDDVTTLLGALLVLAFVRAAWIWSSDVLAQWSASRLKSGLRERLTQHLLTLGPAYTRSESSGELVSTSVEGVEVLDEYITIYQPARLLAAIVPAFVLLVILVIDPWTTLVLIFTGPILVLLLALIGSRAKDITQRRFVEMSWMSAFFLDMLQGIATLKMFGRSREQIENIRNISRHYGNTTMEVLRTAFQTSFVLELGGTIATALVAVEVSLRLMNGLLPFNLALAVLIITPEFFLPMRQLAIRYHSGAAGKAAAERIFTILDTPVGNREPTPDSRFPIPAHFDINFDKVRYAYDDGKRSALQGFSLRIPHGQTVALVGATGAGKTTVASLLLRFISAADGTITVGGVPLDAFELSEWRSQVAWVPQIPHLFHGTIADNIRLARAGARQEAVVAAAQAAHAHEFIQALPQGYDTQVGEWGARLSGGQQQRIAIARAFLKDAPLLILDEATSHLDSENESAIQDALAQLMRGRTVLIIAHRPKLVYSADKVAVLERGRVVEVGAPFTLLTKGRSYNELVSMAEGGAG